MKVKLISYSRPSRDMVDEGLMDVEDLVAFCARVSNPSNQMNQETTSKLIKYLIKHQHWSPLEMVHLTLEIKTTRDISRQIVRHRSFSFQEFSQRYAVSENFVERICIEEEENNVMGVAKASLEANVRYMAYSLGELGIRVNAVSAGPIKTLAAAGIGDFGKMLAYGERNSPLRRNVTIHEVGNVAAFLCSDLASGITGEITYVDAGYNIVGIGDK